MLLSKILPLTLYVLYTQIFILPQRIEGLQCFVCNSKQDHGCKNDELKGGHTNKRFTKTCKESDAVCVKLGLQVSGYYEQHFAGSDLKRYYDSLDKNAACRGITPPSGAGTTSASGGHLATTASAGGPAGVAAGNGSKAAGAGATGAPAGSTTAVPAGRHAGGHDDGHDAHSRHGNHGPGGHQHPPDQPAGSHVHRPADGQNGTGGGQKICPEPLPFPDRVATVDRRESRNVYMCGSRAAWTANGVLNRCRITSDGIVVQHFCTCSSDLCNGAPRAAGLPTAFVLLAAALYRLHGAVG